VVAVWAWVGGVTLVYWFSMITVTIRMVHWFHIAIAIVRPVRLWFRLCRC